MGKTDASLRILDATGHCEAGKSLVIAKADWLGDDVGLEVSIDKAFERIEQDGRRPHSGYIVASRSIGAVTFYFDHSRSRKRTTETRSENRMEGDKVSTSAQRLGDTRPAASPLGRDDEAAGTADRITMAREAEEKIAAAAKQKSDDRAHAQRGSNAPYGKEEHMNEELAKQKERAKVEEDPSEQPS